MQIINQSWTINKADENVLESTKGALTKVHGRTLKNHYQLICREDPWINRYLKNPPIRTKKEGTALHVRRQLLHVQWRHCFAIYTDLQRPNGRVSLRTVKSQLQSVKKYGCCWRTEYTGTREGIAEDRSGEWIYLVQTLIIADEAGEAEKDVNRWSRRSWKRRWMKPHIYIVST